VAVKASAPGADGASDAEEGGAYARAFLARVAAGTASPEELLTLLAFMNSGSMLHGFGAVLFHALRQLLPKGGSL